MSTTLKSKKFEFYQRICKTLHKDGCIRFAGMISPYGKLLIGGFKEGIIPLENDAEQQKMYMELALRVSMKREFDYSLGPVSFSASRRQNAVMMSFPLNQYVLLVSAKTEVNIEELGKKILNLINKKT